MLDLWMFLLFQDITNGKGPNVILEMVASANLQKDLEMIAKDGRIAVRISYYQL